MEFLGELHASLPRADDEHLAVRKRRWVAVLRRVEDGNVRREASSDRWAMRPLVGAAADHDGVGLDRPFAGIQPEALGPAGVEAVHGDALADRPSMVGAVVFKVGHDLVAGHVTLRIAPRVRAAWKVQGPVR